MADSAAKTRREHDITAQNEIQRIIDLIEQRHTQLCRIIAGLGLGSYADDVLGDITVKVLRGKFEWIDEKQTWRVIVRSVINDCAQEHRRRKRFRKKRRAIFAHFRRTAEQSEPAQNAIARQSKEVIRETMKELPDNLLVPLVLKYFCEFNSSQIGKIIGIEPGTVRVRLHKGRKKLADKLRRKGVDGK